MRSDISRLKLQIGSSSRAFNSAMQNIQTSLDGVKQTVDKLVAAGGVVTNNPGGQVPPHTSGTATLSPPSHTTPFTQILHGKKSVFLYDLRILMAIVILWKAFLLIEKFLILTLKR